MYVVPTYNTVRMTILMFHDMKKAKINEVDTSKFLKVLSVQSKDNGIEPTYFSALLFSLHTDDGHGKVEPEHEGMQHGQKQHEAQTQPAGSPERRTTGFSLFGGGHCVKVVNILTSSLRQKMISGPSVLAFVSTIRALPQRFSS